MATQPKVVYEFGPFKVDPEKRTLARGEHSVPVSPKAVETLVVLLRNSREVVSKDDLMKSVWPDAFVEEGNLSQNIFTLRKALGDTGESRRYIVTVPGRGYRFAEQVRTVLQDGEDLVLQSHSRSEIAVHVGAADGTTEAKSALIKPRSSSWWKPAVAAAGVTVLAIGLFVGLRTPSPKVLRIHHVTQSGRVEPWGRVVADSGRIYFLERHGGRWETMQAPITGGTSQPVLWPVPGRNFRVVDVSPDGSEFLVGTFEETDEEMPLWIEPAAGGPPSRLGDVVAYDATWTPEGQEIVYSHAAALFITDNHGHERKLTSTPGIAEWFSWSPDGRRLRFTIRDANTYRMSLWEMARDGRDLHQLSGADRGGFSEWMGRWMPDGHYFVFTSNRDGQQNLWVQKDGGKAVQLTAGPSDYSGAVPARDAQTLFVPLTDAKVDVVRVDRNGTISPFWRDVKVAEMSFSQDGNWVVYSNGALWRSHPDASDRLQLLTSGGPGHAPRISPDNSQILFEDVTPKGTMGIFVASLSSGDPRLVGEQLSRPDWSPDGKKVVADMLDDLPPAISAGLCIVDLATAQRTVIPSSQGLQSPRWSRDGRYISALRWKGPGKRKIMLFDVARGQWRELASARYPTIPEWSHNNGWIYYQDLLEDGEPIRRIDVKTGKSEPVFTFADDASNGIVRAAFLALAPGDELIVSFTRNIGDIYALQVRLP